jgi:membrane protein
MRDATPESARRRARVWSIPLREWPGLVVRVVKESARDRITVISAGLAFHGFLALFPAIVALLGLFGLVGLSTHQLQSLIHGARVVLPAQMSQLLDQALRRPLSSRGSALELVVGVLVALWSAVEAMAVLQISLDVAYETEGDRGFVGRRTMALPLIGLTIAFGGAASVLLILGDPVRSLLPHTFALARQGLDALWFVVRWGGATGLMMVLLSTYYTFGPKRARPRWEWVSPGSVAATLGWLVVSVGFSTYLDHFGRESRTYGAFAGVAAMLLWMFITGLAVLLGAELNRELERVAARRTEEAAASPP